MQRRSQLSGSESATGSLTHTRTPALWFSKLTKAVAHERLRSARAAGTPHVLVPSRWRLKRKLTAGGAAMTEPTAGDVAKKSKGLRLVAWLGRNHNCCSTCGWAKIDQH